MGVDSFILFLPLIAGIIIAVIMKSIIAGIGTGALAGAITLFVKSSDGCIWYFMGGILCVIASALCFLCVYIVEKRERDFKGGLADLISETKLLHNKWNSDDVSSKNYLKETRELMSKVTKFLHKYGRKSEIIRVVGELEFKFDNSKFDKISAKEKHRKGEIASRVSTLDGNLCELQKREK